MPFTYACMIIGGLALSGIPPFSASGPRTRSSRWSSIARLAHALGVAGYIGAFLTAIYTFRMIFRAFHGEQCPEAEELAHGHLYHAPEPDQPGHRRGRGHRHRLPRPGAPHRRAGAGDEDRDGLPGRCWRSSAASCRSRA
jgi:NADH:ubiquinone oxidoreductase subunit 5 (subunit L)/multisubunit Na+/H+ antiporter MnhA subunit